MSMPGHFEVDRKAGIVRVTFTGVLSAEGVTVMRDEAFGHPDVEPGMSLLVDLRGCTDATLSVEAMRRLAPVPDVLGEGKRAFVVERELVYGLSRAWQTWAQAGQKRIEVFRDLEAAEAWLAHP